MRAGDFLVVTRLDRLARSTIRAECQLEGIEKAKACGVVFGRKRRLSEQAVRELKWKRKAGVKIADLMAEFGLSKTSTYRYLASDLENAA